MQLTAKLIEVLAIQTGQGKNGEWKKQDIIVETDGQYPKKVCISIWGDKINEGQLQIGNLLPKSPRLQNGQAFVSFPFHLIDEFDCRNVGSSWG
jgi:hypothetical protein